MLEPPVQISFTMLVSSISAWQVSKVIRVAVNNPKVVNNNDGGDGPGDVLKVAWTQPPSLRLLVNSFWAMSLSGDFNDVVVLLISSIFSGHDGGYTFT